MLHNCYNTLKFMIITAAKYEFDNIVEFDSELKINVMRISLSKFW